MIRILIADVDNSHAEAIRAAISVGYGSDIADQVEIIPLLGNAVQEARNNPNILGLIFCYSGVSSPSMINYAISVYPRVLFAMPLGSNVFEDMNLFQTNEPPIIVTGGAGDTENRNNTGYGKGLEFWDDDNSNAAPADISSYSVPVIFAKLLKIKDILNCTWDEARYRARVTATRTEPNRVTSIWDHFNGYGKINVAAAVAYTGMVPAALYSSEPALGEPGTIELTINNVTGVIAGTIDEVAGATGYKIYRNEQLIFSITGTTFYDSVFAEIETTFVYTYRAVKNSEESVLSAEASITYMPGEVGVIIGMTADSATKYGKSEAVKVDNVSIEKDFKSGDKVLVEMQYFRDAEALTSGKQCLDVKKLRPNFLTQLTNILYQQIKSSDSEFQESSFIYKED